MNLKNAALLSLMAISLNAKADIGDPCLKSPLPDMPKTPNYYLEYGSSTKMGMTFWREPCLNGQGSALLVRVNPITGGPYLYGSDFKILQDNEQFDTVKLITDPTPYTTSYNYWSGNLFISKTFVLANYVNSTNSNPKFDPSRDLKIVYGQTILNMPENGTAKLNVIGSAKGLKNYKYSCKNNNTGKVKYYGSRTGSEWSCQGLNPKPGDQVQIFIKGTME